MDNNLILVNVAENGIAQLILNKPQKHNALDRVFVESFIKHLESLQKNANVKALVISGSGKNFCAGADIKWMQTTINNTESQNLEDARLLAKLMHMLDVFPHPTIVAATGTSYGGGIGIISCCDIAFASPDAQFCFSEVKLGLIPAVISPYVMKAMGERILRRYFLTAEIFTAEMAQQFKLIHEIVSEELLLEKAIATAKFCIANGNLAQQAAKNLISVVHHRELNDSLIEETAKIIAKIRVSEEAQTRLRAFLEKRT